MRSAAAAECAGGAAREERTRGRRRLSADSRGGDDAAAVAAAAGDAAEDAVNAGRAAVEDRVKQRQKKGGEDAGSWFKLYGHAGETHLLDEHELH